MTMKAHTYYIIFGRPPIGGKLPLLPPPGGAADSSPHRPRSHKLIYLTKETTQWGVWSGILAAAFYSVRVVTSTSDFEATDGDKARQLCVKISIRRRLQKISRRYGSYRTLPRSNTLWLSRRYTTTPV